MRGDKKNYPVSLVWLLVATFIAIAFANAAWSSDRITQSNDQNLQTTGDVNTGSNESFAVGGADYDLAGGTCRVHQGGFTVAIATFDEYCQGMGMIDRGMVNAGVRHLCEQSPVGENYDTYAACETELKQVFTKPPPVPPLTNEHLDEEQEYHEEQMQLQQSYDERFAALEAQARRPAPKPQVIRETVADDGAERRAKSRATLSEFKK